MIANFTPPRSQMSALGNSGHYRCAAEMSALTAKAGLSIFRIAIQKLDRDALRAANKTNPHAGPHRGRLAREFDAFLFQLGGNCIDAAHRKTEMIETAIGRDRRRVDAVAGRDRGNEDIGAAKLEIDARFALLHTANDLGAERRLEPFRHGFRVGRAQMNVVPTVFDCLLCQGASPVRLLVSVILWRKADSRTTPESAISNAAPAWDRPEPPRQLGRRRRARQAIPLARPRPAASAECAAIPRV